MAKTLVILELSRFPESGVDDRLRFVAGVNVIVGAPNTGKTKWLQMLDYLLGDDTEPSMLFDDLYDKFDSAQMRIAIADEEFVVERRWKAAGLKTKVLVDGIPSTLKDYREWLMSKLEIPILHYPKGNPYGTATWPELGWRSLCRHIYRRQRFWSDIADQQFPVEQHACIMQFLGLAECLFTKQYGELVSKEKTVIDLRAKKDQFISMLQEVSREVIDESELGVALTPQSIEAAHQRITADIQRFQDRRTHSLRALLDAAGKTEKPAHGRDAIERMSEELIRLQSEQLAAIASVSKAESRLSEMKVYRDLIEDELDRMQRAKKAGNLLADIKVTHCPACDRELLPQKGSGSSCYVCGRSTTSGDDGTAEKRLDLELDQLTGELGETDELIATLSRDIRELSTAKLKLDENLERVQSSLRPVRIAAAAIIPPDLSICDMETGRLQERLQQLRRISASLAHREELSRQINETQNEVARLESEVAEQTSVVDFERGGQLLADGMNDYLNRIKNIDINSWTQAAVGVRLGDRTFRFTIGKSDWRSKLGGTLTLYFLIAYHYSLMSLVREHGTHFPGLVVLDFPGKLEDVRFGEGKENFVVEPFIDLTGSDGMGGTQFIAAGSSFEKLDGANRIKLTHLWA